MATIFSPPKYFQLYAECIDDSLPKFTPNQWVKQNRWYKVKYFAESLNTDTMAITITDRMNNEIIPSDSISAFKIERFILHEICLN